MIGVVAPLDAPGVCVVMTARRRVLYRMMGLAPYTVPLLRII
jgi:hypothetical protein